MNASRAIRAWRWFTIMHECDEVRVGPPRVDPLTRKRTGPGVGRGVVRAGLHTQIRSTGGACVACAVRGVKELAV